MEGGVKESLEMLTNLGFGGGVLATLFMGWTILKQVMAWRKAPEQRSDPGSNGDAPIIRGSHLYKLAADHDRHIKAVEERIEERGRVEHEEHQAILAGLQSISDYNRKSAEILDRVHVAQVQQVERTTDMKTDVKEVARDLNQLLLKAGS